MLPLFPSCIMCFFANIPWNQLLPVQRQLSSYMEINLALGSFVSILIVFISHRLSCIIRQKLKQKPTFKQEKATGCLILIASVWLRAFFFDKMILLAVANVCLGISMDLLGEVDKIVINYYIDKAEETFDTLDLVSTLGTITGIALPIFFAPDGDIDLIKTMLFWTACALTCAIVLALLIFRFDEKKENENDKPESSFEKVEHKKYFWSCILAYGIEAGCSTGFIVNMPAILDVFDVNLVNTCMIIAFSYLFIMGWKKEKNSMFQNESFQVWIKISLVEMLTILVLLGIFAVNFITIQSLYLFGVTFFLFSMLSDGLSQSCVKILSFSYPQITQKDISLRLIIILGVSSIAFGELFAFILETGIEENVLTCMWILIGVFFMCSGVAIRATKRLMLIFKERDRLNEIFK